ncbi:DUF1588 domain-containing protein [Lentisphaera marina]|uniref:DUF1588 domain-containing protein n=1 Tax=Lentisphaera marina TaxID=1111041 RepID=UPI002366A342|nr:DUF1588 domain-containing protein [Lentisphaera marina]MDD7983897.1 DUF1588 domain-containing protein [Lentisphaera marina]
MSKYSCPCCQGLFEYDGDLVGRRVECPLCDHKYTVENQYPEAEVIPTKKTGTKIRVSTASSTRARSPRKKRSKSYAAPLTFLILLLSAGAIYFMVSKNKQVDLAESPSKSLDSHAFIQMPREQLEPFLKKYCIECHGPKKQKGQLRFDTIEWKITNNDSAQLWQDILDQINSGEMPPKKARQAQNKELISTLASLTKGLHTARRRLADHGGEIKMRRLNQREYSNTIKHLFGFDVPLEVIPEDGEIENFDTVGDEQFFTSQHFDKYLKLSREIMKEAFRHSIKPRTAPSTQRVEPEKGIVEKIAKERAQMAAKKKMLEEGKTWQEMGFADEGEFKFWKGMLAHRKAWMDRTMAYPKVESGLYITPVRPKTHISRHTDIRAEYILRIHGGIVGNPLAMRRVALVQDSNGTRATLGLRGTVEKPETVEVRLRQSMGRYGMMLSVSENLPPSTWGNINLGNNHLKRLQGSLDPYNALWIDWLELDGPYYPEKKSFFEAIMTADGPAKLSQYMKDENAADLIEKFAYEAFRRKKANPAFLKGLQSRFHELRAEGSPYVDSMSEVLALILSSPSFLYLQEADSKPSKAPALSNRELAIRMSYFIWSTPPDDELYAAKLANPEIRAAQLDRLLSSPKAKAFHDGFISQWAEFDRFNAITIDVEDQPHFNCGVRHAASREIREFFSTLIKENLPARNFIDSDFVTINSALAAHYGIPGVTPKDDRFVKVTLPADSPRGGLMSQAAFLIAGSNGERSSPVIRGALIMDKLLHDKPAPPPPNVPELSEATDEPKTNREMVKLHQQKAACASCHEKMDVIGFGLENFDTIGRWRDSELVGKEQVTIDPSGPLPSGDSFSKVQDLKKSLLKYEADLAKELVESTLAYGLGRTIEFSDSNEVEAILNKLKDKQYRMRDMIREIALSPLFTKK